MSYSALNTKKVIDVVKYRWLWIIITTILLLPGIIAMIYSSITYSNHSPLRVGIDFTGGTIVQYSVDKDVSTKDINDLTIKLQNIKRSKEIETLLNINQLSNKIYYFRIKVRWNSI